MLDPKGLQALSAVIRFGSFERAAEHLFITQSAVSQRLKLLEERIGHTLLLRSSPPRPTPAGASVLKYTQQLEQLEQSLYSELQPQQRQGWIHMALAVNADTLATWLLKDCLCGWCRQQKVILELKVDDQDQTHRLLQNGSVIGCISALETPPQGCRSFALGFSPYLCVASPQFKKRWFSTASLKDGFSRAPATRFNSKDFLQHQFLAKYFALDADQLAMHTMPSSEGFVEWLSLGMGWGMAPRSQVQSDIDSVRLVELTPGKRLKVKLYWHLWGLDTQLTQSLTHAIQTAARQVHEFS